jgi:uncharacterized protein YjdB
MGWAVIVNGVRSSLGGLETAVDLPARSTFVAGISVTPPVATVPTGGQRMLAAVAQLSTGGSVVVTGDLTWSSSDEAVATVEGGRITGESAGVAVITGTSAADERFGAMTITVTEP